MLPLSFMPNAAYSLVRLGRDHGGGYLVETQSLWQSARLVSLGVGDDWSFEKDFLRRQPVPLAAYDPGLTDQYLLDRGFVHVFGMLALQKTPLSVVESFWKLRDYRAFFRGQRVHHRLKAGYDGRSSKSLRRILEEAGPEGPVFLKVALEGWEYHILDDVVRHAERLSGLLIEFHGANWRRRRIAEFLRACPLTLVHIHGDNTDRFVDVRGDPSILEMTFANDPRAVASEPRIPHPLDRRNNTNYREVALHFGV